jgi:CBS domain-containing protein
MPTLIRDLMTPEAVSVEPDITLKQLDRVLLSYGVSGVAVVEGGVLIGVISRTDVIRFLYNEQVEASQVSGYYQSPFPIPIPALEHLAQDTRRIADHMTRQKVREIMSTDVRTVTPEDDAQSVAAMMASEGLHRLPVLEHGKLVGIVSSMDLVRRLGEVGRAAG